MTDNDLEGKQCEALTYGGPAPVWSQRCPAPATERLPHGECACWAHAQAFRKDMPHLKWVGDV